MDKVSFFCWLRHNVRNVWRAFLFLGLYLENLLHKDGILKGLILAIPLLGLCLTSYLVGSYVKQKTNKMKWLIVTGLMGSCLMMAFVPWTERFLYLSALLLFIGVGCGFILPCLNTLITSAVGYQERGMITSLYSSVRFLGVALAFSLIRCSQ